MKLEFDNLAHFEIELTYHGWGMPLTTDVVVNCMNMHYGPITETRLIKGSFYFDESTPFKIEIGLRDKTYAHTDLAKGLDHCIEISKLKFMNYDLLPLMHDSVYWAHIDCENPNPATMTEIHGSKILGQNGRLHLGTIRKPFFTWYHEITHQGVLYELT
jgi:hypothetical protein